MAKRQIMGTIALGAALLVNACGLAVPGIGQQQGLYAATPTAVAAGSGSATVKAGLATAQLRIEIGDTSFTPQELRVPAGTTIVWTNTSRRQHTVTAADTSFDSGPLAGGASFSRRFDSPGIYQYYCAFHGDADGNGMVATVVVTPAAAVAAASPTVAVSPTAVAAPTSLPTAAPTVAPTAVAVATAPPPPAAQLTGRAIWRDQSGRNDAFQIAITDLPAPPSGYVQAAWLLGKEARLYLGTVTRDASGAARLTYSAPDQQNLLARYERVAVTTAPPADADRQLDQILLAGGLPEKALVHIRHVLFSIGITPNKTGFALGLRQETDELRRHAEFMQEARAANNLALVKLHAEHMVNLIEGTQGEHFGDLNGNGKADNPGDGYGLLTNGKQDGYIKGMNDHAKLAAESPDATSEIKVHAGHVQIAGENTHVRVAEVRDRALAIFKARTVAEVGQDVQRILALAQQTIQGLDSNGDEQVAPIPGEGGVLTAYQHAQLMGAVFLTADGAATTGAPADQARPAQPTAAAPTSPTAHDHTQPTPSAKPTAPAAQPTAPAAQPTAPAAQPTAPAVQATAPAVQATASAIQPTAPAAQATASAATVAPPPSAAGELQIIISDSSFSQKTLRVPVGATVTWLHRGQTPHTVTADDGSFNSDTLRNGATFRQTFTKPGTYRYYCDFHGGPGGVGMSAVIEVGN